MRIKLIYPPNMRLHYESRIRNLPYGLGVLAAFLRHNNLSVDLYDLNARLKSPHAHVRLRKIFRELIKFHTTQVYAGRYTGIADRKNDVLAGNVLDLVGLRGYDMVGIGIMSVHQILEALLIAEKIKKEYKIPVVMGGPYVTLFADLFFRKYNFIDYAIVGEGEIPLLRLLQSIERKEKIQGVPSLWYRDNSRVIFNGRTFYNIENQPRPDYEGLPLELYDSSALGREVLCIPYSTSKGCIGRCSFCLYPTVDGPWQCKSVKKVVKDIIFLKEKYKCRNFKFVDSKAIVQKI